MRGPVVKNLPANAGDMDSIPGPRRSQHAMEQLSPCATAIEPMLQSLGAATSEEPVLCNEKPLQLHWSPHLLQLERESHSSEAPVPKINKQIHLFKRRNYDAGGIKFANQLTVKWEIILVYPGVVQTVFLHNFCVEALTTNVMVFEGAFRQ